MAKEANMQKIDAEVENHLKQYLHWPARIDHLEKIDEHLTKAARLSRALWETLSNDELDTQDPRTRLALVELADDVADHASAADFIYNAKIGGKVI